MSDNQQDGGQETQEAALPKPSFQDVPDDKQHSAAANGSAPSGGLTAEQVAEIVKRELQSVKDSRVDKVYKSLGVDPKQIVEAIKGGKDPDQVLAEIQNQTLFDRLNAIEEKLAPPKPQSSPNGSAERDEAFAKAVGLVTKAGLASDPEVQKIMGGSYKNATDFLLSVNEVVLSRNTKSTPSGAGATMPAGGALPAEPDPNALVRDYTSEMVANRGNASAIKAVKEKYRKLGVPVDSVGFNF